MKVLKPANNSIAVLVSGGADSAVLLQWALRKYRPVYPVYVRQGYRWESAEIYWLNKFLKKIGLKERLILLEAPINDLLRNHWSLTGKKVPNMNSDDGAVYLPGRNLFLFSKAAAFCANEGIGNLAVGTLKGNPFADANRTYFRNLQKIFKASFHFNVQIRSPFSRWTKKEVLRYGKGLPLYLTFSCLNPKGLKPCGRCNKCAERGRAFKSLSFGL